uniref:EpsG family protein n=1 Tax=uncultured Sphingomonas sp. TaxID=158754 RepID=UPI0035C987C5
MLPYWLLFTLWAAGAVQAERRRAQDPRLIFFILAAVLTILMIGMRFEVGGDWGAYQNMYEEIFFLPLPAAVEITDPGYATLNWLGAQFGFGVTFVNLVCAALFVGGLARLALRQPNPALAMLVAVPYLIIVVAMGYTRQAAAIGIVCFAIADPAERLWRLIVLVGVAALFHKTAVLLLPVLMVPIMRRNMLYGVLGFLVSAILFALVLRDSSDQMMNNYVQSSYDSQGAAIRVAMNLVAALMFLLLRKRIILSSFQKSYWATCAVLAFLSVPALALASASAGIDRISLYLIPLQVVVYARLPHLLSRDGKALPSILIGVIAYCFLVQFVWLNYADNAGYWVPYTSVLEQQ